VAAATIGPIERPGWANAGLRGAPPGAPNGFIRGDEIIGNQIFMSRDDITALSVVITSNFFDPRLVPFAVSLLRRAAVEVRHCYRVVTKSEFALPLSEQLQTPGFRADLGGRRHLVSQRRGCN
jgi:hypothetical protein